MAKCVQYSLKQVRYGTLSGFRNDSVYESDKRNMYQYEYRSNLRPRIISVLLVGQYRTGTADQNEQWNDNVLDGIRTCISDYITCPKSGQ